LAGLRRYLHAIGQIEAGQFRPAQPSVIVMAALLIVIAVLAIAFIVLLRP
jgi:uncharacterized membrane protein YidH (DUF202 family)